MTISRDASLEPIFKGHNLLFIVASHLLLKYILYKVMVPSALPWPRLGLVPTQFVPLQIVAVSGRVGAVRLVERRRFSPVCVFLCKMGCPRGGWGVGRCVHESRRRQGPLHPRRMRLELQQPAQRLRRHSGGRAVFTRTTYTVATAWYFEGLYPGGVSHGRVCH